MTRSRAQTQGVSRPRRQAGRPSENDSVGRDAILQSAIVLLRQKSAAQLTLSDVAAAAKVDRALIRYYFRDKAGLLKAVAAQVLNELQGRSQDMYCQQGSLEEKIRMRLELLIDVMHEMPQFSELVFKEIYVAEDGGEPGSNGAEGIAQGVVDRGLALTRVLIDSAEVDATGRETDPRFLHLMMLGACVFFANSGPLLHRMFGEKSSDRKLTEDYISFVTRMLMRGLGAPLPRQKAPAISNAPAGQAGRKRGRSSGGQ
ncbi:TetR/AcrR family transcriptional regulator [Pusillimonas noertemannii]|uniref:TetR family transcriptional regulator n=1 Tax=Pusillimonas noertemannii TaxID=305977 RepID=A0A2U1CRH3_9BURK|nr:TetR/AcrR family transcriptional regulator [Pusillimonas noertemannii]NYT67829.1 TetR/AcrR family transcriptional regulator [Pusillimonas noertemannii]PVY68500.1 TetR family transcriptional regulator [Pusillimonas noertemannii]TFL12022.1 TetR/AcrR family transcriptional regulator [Pusillimonas noertemannii]